MKYLAIFLLSFFVYLQISSTILAQEPAQQPNQTTQANPNQPTPSQTSNTLKTAKSNVLCIKIGDAKDEDIPAGCSSGGSTTPIAPGAPPDQSIVAITTNTPTLRTILNWDEMIVSGLQPGLWGYFNKLTTPLANNEGYSTGTWSGANEDVVYWCTYSIIDAYRLAGVPGLSKTDASEGNHKAVVFMRNFWRTTGVTKYGYKYVDYEANNQSLKEVQPGYAMFMEKEAGRFTSNEHVNMVKEISIDASGKGHILTNDSNSSRKGNTYQVVNWRILESIYPVRGFGGI